ncbi:MAG TPA: hypothetical protein VML55_02430 [Planctomycetaceae bacterium]|nr:hypothetical protein [Planctomycetaceae bacterium]
MLVATHPLAGRADEPAREDAAGDMPLTIILKDGRLASGQLDPRTDSRRLWIRTGETAITLASGFAWEAVRGVRHGERRLTSAELESMIGALHANPPVRRDEQPTAVSGRRMSVEPPISTGSGVRPLPARVVSLYTEACLANWDADAEADGVRVRIVPLDADGRIVTLDAQLDIVLHGVPKRSWSGPDDRRRNDLPELGRWTRRVRAADFGPDGAVYDLEFQGEPPERDGSLASWGSLSARLGVAGRGAFDASAEVLLRPYEPRNIGFEVDASHIPPGDVSSRY